MLLKKIIKGLHPKTENINISGLSLDSRKVKKGDIFFALGGKNFKEKYFFNEAIKKGAKVIVTSSVVKIKNKNISIIKVKNIKNTLTFACKVFFKNKPKNIIAVTGTNGKSSIADFYHQIFFSLKIPVASIGTLGIKKNNKVIKSNLTTLDIISLHRELEKLKKLGIENVILEASSHGLSQGRLNGINFNAAIFTNLSQDHLDYHKTMRKYLEAKLILFKKLLREKKFLITNNTLKEFHELKKTVNEKKLKLLTIGDSQSTIEIKKYSLEGNHQRIYFCYNKKNYHIKTHLIGSFQIENLFMAVLAAKTCNVSLKKIFPTLKKIKEVNGRLQLVRSLTNKTKVYIDYAHTPDALRKTLESLKNHYQENIILVFGCGGNRDKKKRSLMAKIAETYCSKIYVTDDNPRLEDPKLIRRMIIKGFLKKNNVHEIPTRSKAIRSAIINSEPKTIILIAGKGHEENQIYKNKIIKISDKMIVKKTKIQNLKYNEKDYNKYFNSKVLEQITNKKNLMFLGASIDSREVKKDNIFIAIKGDKQDGHNFVNEALKNKASFCVVSKKTGTVNKKQIIKCNNTNIFLNKLASIKRSQSKAKIIAITGSSGKTTFKSLLGEVLSCHGSTYCSKKSFNNHYGVPISLSNLENNHKYGVFEIGMSNKGEINKLSKIVKPHIGIITNTGEAHIENFKNLKGIADAKAEIMNNIKKGGYLVLNYDDNFSNYISKKAKQKKIKIISFGMNKKSNVFIISRKRNVNNNILKIKVFNKIIFLKVRNIDNIDNIKIYNILCSVAILSILKLDLHKSKHVLNNFLPIKGRGKKYKVRRFKKNFYLIDESYNANPFSVKNAISAFSKQQINSNKKYLLLGDMLELGKKSNFYHANLSNYINQSNIDKLFIYGNKAFKTYQKTYKSKQGNILQNLNDFDEIFSKIIKRNDYLMIKGSNATRLNSLSSNIIKGKKNAL
jgi:murE/murF fusion protein